MNGYDSKRIALGTAPTQPMNFKNSNSGYICYVDDSRTSSYVTKKILKEYGYIVDHFESAESAVISIIENNYDLLLTDLTLSSTGMDGDELILFLRKSDYQKIQSLPIIVITGSSDKELLLKIYDAGANGVLIKPVSGFSLDEKIKALILDNTQDFEKESSPEDKPEEIAEHEIELELVDEQQENPVQTPVSVDNELNDAAETMQEQFKELSELEEQEPEPQNLFESFKNAKPELSALERKSENETSITPELESEYQDQEVKESEQSKIIESIDSLEPDQDIELKTTDADTDQIQKDIDSGEESAAKLISRLRAQAKAEADSDEIPILPLEEKKQELANDAFSFSDFEIDNEPLFGSEMENLFADIDADEIENLSLHPNESEIISSKDIKSQHKKTQAIKPELDAENTNPEKLISTETGLVTIDNIEEVIDFQDDLFQPGVVSRTASAFRKSRIVSVLIIIALSVLISGAWNYIQEQDTVLVETVKVTYGTLHQSLTVPGTVVSKLNIDIKPAATGKIVNVLVREGETVPKGEPLVQIEDGKSQTLVKKMEGRLATAQEETILAEKTLERMRRALAVGAVSRQQWEESQAFLKSKKAKESIAIEELKSARQNVDNLQIRAPFAGTITSSHVHVDQIVSSSDTLFSLVDLDQREIEVKIDASDGTSISSNQEVLMSSDAFPNKKWKEKVVRVSPAIIHDDKSTTIPIHISLGPGAPPLRYGQSVNADIRIFTSAKKSKLPLSAIVTRNYKTWVGKIENGRVHFVNVETGMEDISHVEIKSGISVGDEIILPQGIELNEGDRVRIVASRS